MKKITSPDISKSLNKDFNSFTPPDEKQIRATQSIEVLKSIFHEIKRLGELLTTKDYQINSQLIKSKDEIETVLNNYCDNSEILFKNINGGLENFDTISDKFNDLLTKEGQGLQKINSDINQLKEVVKSYGQSANTHTEGMGRLNSQLIQTVTEIKNILAREDDLALKTIVKPSIPLQNNNERVIINKLDTISQTLNTLTFEDSLKTNNTSIDSLLKTNNTSIDSLLKTNNTSIDSLLKTNNNILIDNITKIIKSNNNNIESLLKNTITETTKTHNDQILNILNDIRLKEKDYENTLNNIKNKLDAKQVRIDKSQEDSIKILKEENGQLTFKIEELTAKFTKQLENTCNDRDIKYNEYLKIKEEVENKTKIINNLEEELTKIKNPVIIENTEIKSTIDIIPELEIKPLDDIIIEEDIESQTKEKKIKKKSKLLENTKRIKNKDD